MATNGEFKLGAGKPYRSLLGVFWGTGVGGGLVLEGKRWLGRGAAGEIGHMVVREGGRRCPCGRRGCMEAYAGRAAMEAKARREVNDGEKTDLFEIMTKHGKDRLTSSIWDRALRHEDPLAVGLIDDAVKALATGVASAVNLLDIEAVVIGGGLGVRLGEPYVERIRKRMGRHLFLDGQPPAVSSRRSAISAAPSAPHCYSTSSASGLTRTPGRGSKNVRGVAAARFERERRTWPALFDSQGLRQPPWPVSMLLAASGPQVPGA